MYTQNTSGIKCTTWWSSIIVRYFEGVNCHFLNIGVKNANRWIVQEVKYIFPNLKAITL
jgi:hypothetical protein